MSHSMQFSEDECPLLRFGLRYGCMWLSGADTFVLNKPGSEHVGSRTHTNNIPNMAPSGEVQAETLQKFLDAWAAWDFDAWRQTFDENFTQVTMPFNMNVPERTLEEVEHALPKLMEMVDDYEVC